MRSAYVCLVVIACTACATSYKPAGAMGGYEDFEVPGRPGVHYVSVRGNWFTSRAQVAEIWYRRAAELCAPEAYELVALNSEVRTTEIGDISGTVPVHEEMMDGYINCKPSTAAER